MQKSVGLLKGRTRTNPGVELLLPLSGSQCTKTDIHL